MRSILATLSFTLIILCIKTAHSQAPVPIPSVNTWRAHWIASDADDGNQYGVYYFNKNFRLEQKPSSFVVHVSADNRYKLYVNGTLVSLGPARGDLHHWNYETVDLAPHLEKGENKISAIVWNEAQYRPEAIISFRTGFILQGNTNTEEVVNTNNTWKCIKNLAYEPIAGFFAASNGELVNMHRHTAMRSSGFDDTNWPAAKNLFEGRTKGTSDGFGWMLVPSPLPQMEMTYQRIPSLRKTTGMTAPKGFPATRTPTTVPANTTVTFILDQTYLTNAYVTLNFSRGKDAGISMRFAETMYIEFNQYGGRKGNRDVVEGKIFSGRKDSIVSNGSNGQSYTHLNFRTYRYIQMIVQTKDEPLIIDDIYSTFTGYPFKQPATYQTKDAEAQKILEIGWRTARLNAFETYTDCPYYEQLQYIGDTRVQAMITYYNSSDERLPRYAIDLMDMSRLPEGVTYSRYPTRGTQIISTFSLWYIGMLHDYWMYKPDSLFIKNKLAGARSILQFFEKYQQEDGSLKNTPYWTFVDWVGGENWEMGSPKTKDGSSAILDLQLLWAYQWAAELETNLGMKAFAEQYKAKAAQLRTTIREKYWSESQKLFADTREKNTFSQHANSLAVLTGMVSEADLPELGKRLLTDKSLTQCTIYFKYYLHQALTKAGLGEDYMNWLGIWRDNIKWGLTTWTEDSNIDYSRSDCHAWGSSPNIEFFRTVLGIDTDAPGFSKVKIEPHLGAITNVGGTIPHPNGHISVKYALEKKRWKINIDLPKNTSGRFVWKGKVHQLKEGNNQFAF